MKKFIVLLLAMLCVFSLAACNKNDKQSVDYKQVTAEEILSYDNYKMTISMMETQQGEQSVGQYTGTSSTTKIVATKETEIVLVSYQDKQNTLVKADGIKIINRTTFDLNTLLTASGKTLEEFKAYAETMAQSMQDPNAIKIDEENGKVTFSQDLASLMASSEDSYRMYDATLKQYKILRVVDGKVNGGEYSSKIESKGMMGTVELASLRPLLEEVISKGAFDKGVYTYEPGEDEKTENGDSLLDLEDINRMTLSTVGGKVVLTIAGESKAQSVVATMELSDINTTSFTIPNAEVPCVSEHKYTKWQAFETGHRKVCCECGKCLDVAVKEHNLDDESKICLDCYDRDDLEDYKPDFLYGKNLDHVLLEVYTLPGTDMLYANGNTNVYYKYDYSETKSEGLYAHYFYKDGILILSEFGEDKKISEDYCFYSQPLKYTLLNVKLNLTDEQKKAIEDKDSTASTIFQEALDLPDTVAEIKAKYTNVLKELVVYCIYSTHSIEETTDVKGCAEVDVDICENCGKVDYLTVQYNHDRPVTYIDKPAWGTEGNAYFTLGECAKCHEPSDRYIYEIEASRLEEHADFVRLTFYKADGTRVGTTYANTPHKVKDSVCEFCGKHNLVVGNVSVFVGAVTWDVDFVGGDDGRSYVDEEDGYTMYEYVKGEDTFCKLGYKYSEDYSEIEWKLVVGEESKTVKFETNMK